MIPDRCRRCRDETVWWAIVVDVLQVAFEGVLGFVTGSSALVADALRSGADVVSSVVTLISVKISQKEPDENYPYGYGNVQFISASVVGLMLIFGSLYMIYENIQKVVDGNLTPPNIFAILGAAVSILVNELMYRFQRCVGQQNNSPAIIANAWNSRSNALFSSIGVLIGIGIALLGFPVADVVAAMVVALLVIKIGVKLNVDALGGLMDRSVAMDDVGIVFDIAAGTPKVLDVRYVRGRNVGDHMHFEIGISVDETFKVYQSDLIADAVKERIMAELGHATDVLVMVFPIEAKSARKKKPPRDAALAPGV